MTIPPPIEYPFKTEPRKHQLTCWRATKDKEYHALLMDMGTGKSWVVINTAAWLYDHGKINSVLVIAPKGVYSNWLGIWTGYNYDDASAYEVNELPQVPAHIPLHIQWRGAYYDANARKAQRDHLDQFLSTPTADLRILTMNVESFVSKDVQELAEKFLIGTNCLLAIDESLCIKNPKALRTKAMMKLRRLAPYRRILCGNPYADSPLDIYAPAAFLEPNALGFASWFAFRARYARMQDIWVGVGNGKQRNVKKIVGYRHMEELQRRVGRFATIIKKEECLDLPPKIYLPPRDFEMVPKQAATYEEMREKSLITISDQMVLPLMPAELQEIDELTPLDEDLLPGRSSSAKIVLTQLLRLQQIACGFVTMDDGQTMDLVEGENPRINAMMDAIQEERGKVIIWADFTRSIEQICAALGERYGQDSFVRYDGSVTRIEDLERAKALFQGISPVRFFVGNPSKGGYGNTLTAASLMLYYTNKFHNAMRQQSEDRAHRDGLTHSVSYQDLRARFRGRQTVDDKVQFALRTKTTIAQMLMDGTWKRLFQ